MPRSLTPLAVAVVNDYPVVTAGVAAVLRPFEERVRVREFPGVLPPRGSVDVVLFDAFGRPDPELRLKEIVTGTGAKVLVYSWVQERAQIEAAVRIGAKGFLSKTVDAEEMVTAIEAVGAGQTLHPPEPAPGSGDMPAWPGQSEGLTAREAEILSLIVAGLTNQEIAESCYLSINSVKTYVRTAYRKMGVRTRAQAVVWGIDHGFRIVGAEGQAPHA